MARQNNELRSDMADEEVTTREFTFVIAGSGDAGNVSIKRIDNDDDDTVLLDDLFVVALHALQVHERMAQKHKIMSHLVLATKLILRLVEKLDVLTMNKNVKVDEAPPKERMN